MPPHSGRCAWSPGSVYPLVAAIEKCGIRTDLSASTAPQIGIRVKIAFFFCRLARSELSIVTYKTKARWETPVIVCSCNVLTDNDVRTALSAEQTPRTTGQVYGCLGCSAQCGRCARTIRRIMDEALSVAAGASACQCCPSGQHRAEA